MGCYRRIGVADSNMTFEEFKDTLDEGKRGYLIANEDHTAFFELDGEKLDLAHSKISNFKRVLDFKTGILTRSFVWELENGKKTEVVFERLLSMTDVKSAVQRILITTLNYSGKIKVTSGLDFSVVHYMQKKNMWNCSGNDFSQDKYIQLSIEGTTVNTKKKVFSLARIDADFDSVKDICEDKFIAAQMEINLESGKQSVITKYVTNVTLRDCDTKEEYNSAVRTALNTEYSYEEIKSEQEKWWNTVWEKSDIEINGDVENQQGIRFCIFQLFQTYHGAVYGANIGAKGLTGEAYNGNAFWDTETYCLPFFAFNNREAAKNLLLFRYATLDEAKKRAAALDCDGAFYPIATISGKECCDLWQHASLQLQASTGVAYGIWFYEKLYNDKEFVNEYGLEMLIEISRMLATRGDYNADKSAYGYYCVMGPDEFQMMVHNNCYTNYMGKFTLEYTLAKIDEIKAENASAFEKIQSKLAVKDSEIEAWKDIADKMYIPYHPDTKLYEQHEGFFTLPHVDVDAIPVEDFPLYSHWSYDRIYRNDMIKQPDVLMFMLLFNSRFSMDELKANYEFYEPKCIHESSLSPSVHSILAAQLGKHSEAYDFFGFATRMDLDNYNRNTSEGIHTTSIAAAWMNIVYGFGGLRTDGDMLEFSPSIPKDWDDYSFKLSIDNKVLTVRITKSDAEFKLDCEGELKLKVYDTEINVGAEKISVNLK